jgi:hypothetical protein
MLLVSGFSMQFYGFSFSHDVGRDSSSQLSSTHRQRKSNRSFIFLPLPQVTVPSYKQCPGIATTLPHRATHLYGPYHRAADKIKQDQDPSVTIVDEEIGKRITEA